MNEDFNYLFQYLEKENIVIDKSEFDFQIQSHPDYPTLLSVVDTLSFFNIKNGVLQVDYAEIDALPDHFVALLNLDGQQLCFIEKKGESYIYKKVSNTTDEYTLSPEVWSGFILLLEKPENEVLPTASKKSFSWVLPVLCFVLFSSYLFYTPSNLITKLFFVFPAIGILFSIAALKDLFGTKIKLLNSFCNMASSTSCSTVVNSDKWKIFEIINFSDLSVVFFVSQLTGFFSLLLLGDTAAYFSIQKVLLLGALPILLLSLYFQKMVEKKWCPICLTIMSVVLLELIYLFVFENTVFAFSPVSIIVFSLVVLTVVTIWISLKEILIKQKELKEYQLKAIRFEKNYDVFRNSLLAKEKTEMLQSPLLFGNRESSIKIVLISNPFCGYCKDAHTVIETILEKYSDDVKIELVLKADLERENEHSVKLFRSLINIYMNEGEKSFLTALQAWFENTNLTAWLERFPRNITSEFDSIFDFQYKWCEENDFNFTPAILINGYEYPKMYDRKTLPFFIKDFIEDEF